MTTLRDTEATRIFGEGTSRRLGERTFATINGHTEVGVVVYVDDGKITALEAYTFGGESWPEEIHEFEIKYHAG